MEQYRIDHECCPKCQGKQHSVTFMGFVFNSDTPEAYKDLNNCQCSNCKDRHTYHERVKQK